MISKRKRIIIVAAVVIGIGAVVTAENFWHRDNHGALFASGTVEATDAQLGFEVPGRIEYIAVHEGDKVKTGQVLARLDMTETKARLAQAQAQLAAAKARLVQARRDLKRAKRLLAGGAIGQESFDKTQLALDVADSDHRQAQAAIKTIQAMLDNMTIVASFDGLVTIRHHEPGEIVPAGSPVLTVMNPADRWVRIYLPENRIGAVHVGEKAAITTDTYPNKHYGGKVSFVASEAEFTPKNVQTTEERVKLVYAVKVQITTDPGFDLKPGIPADVHLEPGS